MLNIPKYYKYSHAVGNVFRVYSFGTLRRNIECMNPETKPKSKIPKVKTLCGVNIPLPWLFTHFKTAVFAATEKTFKLFTMEIAVEDTNVSLKVSGDNTTDTSGIQNTALSAVSSQETTRTRFSIRDIIGEKNSSTEPVAISAVSSRKERLTPKSEGTATSQDMSPLQISAGNADNFGRNTMLHHISSPLFPAQSLTFQGGLPPLESVSRGGYAGFPVGLGQPSWMYHNLYQRHLWLEGEFT